MITSINSSNKAQYADLFTKAVKVLKTKTYIDSDTKVEKKYFEDATYVLQSNMDADIFDSGHFYVKATDSNGIDHYNTATEYFEDVEYYAKEDSVSIMNLADYFANYALLVQPNNENDLEEIEKLKIFTKLPLDEPYFWIDANNRTIEIPDDFKKNGIGVKGDHGAETLYFKINRYYDNTDLANPDMNIYIQWVAASKGDEALSGVSYPWLVDTESEPGYIIFGWPISNQITKDAGSIQFSVRFYSLGKNTDELTFSLSTLISTVNVNQSLDFDIVNDVESGDLYLDQQVHSAMRERIVNSPKDNVSTEASMPVFVVDEDGNMMKDKDGNYLSFYIDENDKNEKAFLNLTEDNDLISAYAYSKDDAGKISYFWKGYELKEDNSLTKTRFLDFEDISEYQYEAIDPEEEYDANKFYVIIDDIDNIPVLDASTAYPLTEEEFEDADKAKVYSRIAGHSINKIGAYMVVVTNRVGGSRALVKSCYVIVPNPCVPEIITDLNERQYIDDDNTLKVSVKVDSADAQRTISAGTLRTDWKNGENSLTSTFGERTLNPDETETEIEFTQEIIDEGYYTFSVSNALNNSETERVIASTVCRATKDPKVPEFKTTSNGQKVMVVIEDSAYTEANGLWDTTKDNIKYQWYTYYEAEKELQVPDQETFESILKYADDSYRTPNSDGDGYINLRFYGKDSTDAEADSILIISPKNVFQNEEGNYYTVDADGNDIVFGFNLQDKTWYKINDGATQYLYYNRRHYDQVLAYNRAYEDRVGDDIKIEGAETNEYTVPSAIQGSFRAYCKITVTYNEKTTSVTTPLILLND